MTPQDSATRIQFYRELARSLRVRGAQLANPEAREEVYLLAAEYERLADYVEGSCEPSSQPENVLPEASDKESTRRRS
jgi:hypothetical protein